jgi:hyperosmotically inducible protein
MKLIPPCRNIRKALDEEFGMKSQKLINFIVLSFLVTAQPVYADSGIAGDAVKLANKTVNLVKDSTITGFIYAQIALDNNLSQDNINVSTNRGEVTLEGTVDSDTEASAVIQLASSAAGVVSVDASRLKVKKSTQPFTDLVITAKVKGTFIREKLFDDKDLSSQVKVETKNGVVYLSGTAGTAAQAQNAIKLTQSVSGVTRVESSIKVLK